MQHKTCSLACSCWPALGTVIWILAVAALVTAWVTDLKGGALFGRESSFWLANALVLGVLAIPMEIKRSECVSCGEYTRGKK